MPVLRGELGLMPLPDLIRKGLIVLFVGFNPGRRSAEIGHAYAHPGNRFWWLLHQAGFTDRQLKPQEDGILPAMGFGVTDIVARPSKSSSDLAGWELRSGREELLDKLRTYQPAVACYNGLGIYRALTGKKEVQYGLQPDAAVEGVLDFVAASPSGRSREPVGKKLELYRQLRELARTFEEDPRA